MTDKLTNNSPGIQKIIVYIILAVVTFAVYRQVYQFDFVNFDDNMLVTENYHIQSGINQNTLRWAFTTNHADLWNPFLWLSFLLDYQLYGLNAGGYHVTNLILHILSALMLFWLFNRMTGALWPSAFVAAVFALHPLHVESVAWVTERKDVLSAFFWMLTLCFYAWYTEKPVIKRYLFVLFSFFFALMSKSMVVTLPVIMILLDYWPLKRFELQKGKINIVLWQLREKTPFFVLSAVFVIITLYVQYYIPSLKLQPIPLNARLANASVSFVAYLEKTFWPHDMAVFYPFTVYIPVWQVIGAFLLILVITVFVITMIKRMPHLFVGWLWFSIAILPVIKIIHIGNDAMADRYHYLPSIGISIMAAWGILSLIKNKFIQRNILFPSAIIVVTLFAALTWKQCGYWKNSIELFSHTLLVTKNNALAYVNRGSAYGDSGNHKLAIADYNEAIRLKPDDADAYYNRGNSYAATGFHELAIEDYNRAIGLKPNAQTYNNRGYSYDKLGRYQLAIEDYNQAIHLKPDNVKFFYNRGFVFAKLGQNQQAIGDFNEAIRLKPDSADAYDRRGTVYLIQGQNEAGCVDAQRACALGDCKLLEMAKGKGICR